MWPQHGPPGCLERFGGGFNFAARVGKSRTSPDEPAAPTFPPSILPLPPPHVLKGWTPESHPGAVFSGRTVAVYPVHEGPWVPLGGSLEHAGPLPAHLPTHSAPRWSWQTPRGSCDWAWLVSHVYPGAGFSGVAAFSRGAPLGRGRAFGKELVAPVLHVDPAFQLGCSPLGGWANHILPLILVHCPPASHCRRCCVLMHPGQRCSWLPGSEARAPPWGQAPLAASELPDFSAGCILILRGFEAR